MKQIETLEPEMQEIIKTLLQKAKESTGVDWIVTSGRRTMKEQDRLYNQGRTTPGPIVTKAPAGSSAHNFGLAADLAPMKGNDIWWNAPKSTWKKMADEAVKLGLTSGYYFKTIFDGPHVEHPKWKQMQAKWRSGEIEVA